MPHSVPKPLLRTIRELHRRRAPMNLAAMKRRQPELLAEVYALKPFVGWKNALEAAGIDYGEINTELLDYVTCPICGKDLAMLGWHFSVAHETSTEEVREEYPGRDFTCETMRAARTHTTHEILPHWEPLWTAEYVLDRIAEYRVRNLPLNHGHIDNALAQQGLKHFGSWQAAIERAGLRYDEISLTPNKGKFDTAEQIVAAIREQRDAGLSLAPVELASPETRAFTLLAKGRSVFGSWAKALSAAGIDPAAVMGHHHERYAEPEQVVSAIRDLRAAGKPINPAAVESLLYARACEHFGTWRAAAETAGIDPEEAQLFVRRTEYATKGEVIAAIRTRLQNELAVNLKSLERGDSLERRLLRRAIHLFGSWDAALDASGAQPAQHKKWRPSPYRDARAVLDGILRRHRERLPLHVSSLCKGRHRDRALYRQATAFFRSWDEAVRRAGLEPERLPKGSASRYPGPEAVVAAIQERRRDGLPLSFRRVTVECKDRDPALYQSAKRFFGSWAAALEASGLDPGECSGKRSRYPRPETVLKEIRRRHREKTPIYAGSVVNGEALDRALYKRAVKYFGSWDEAVRSAGFDPETQARPPVRFPDGESVVAAIRDRARVGLPLNQRAVGSDGPSPDPWLYGSARRFFGGWPAALRAAGFDPDEHHARKSRYRNREAVVKEIRRRHSESLSLIAGQVNHGPARDIPLVKQATRLFGSWKIALLEAGIDPGKVGPQRRFPDAASIVAAIRERHRLGKPLNPGSLLNSGPNLDAWLVHCAKEHFGTWPEALRAAGFDPDHHSAVKRSRYPGAESVLEEIRRRHSEGIPINAGSLCAGKAKDIALYKRAGKFFGSWNGAVTNAGVDGRDPPLHRRASRSESVGQ